MHLVKKALTPDGVEGLAIIKKRTLRGFFVKVVTNRLGQPEKLILGTSHSSEACLVRSEQLVLLEKTVETFVHYALQELTDASLEADWTV